MFLNIFNSNISYVNNDYNQNFLWNKLYFDEIEQSVMRSPANPFEEYINLTKEGKLWKYPINNEQGKVTS